MTWPNYNWPRVKNGFVKPPLKNNVMNEPFLKRCQFDIIITDDGGSTTALIAETINWKDIHHSSQKVIC
ncbi:hypothetical protein H5410_018028 [Solanum commersonii]|uniref:Uncharacterized protein n=1 Tax=Solanum commersonii TaxID=4109 RepID=A0A9J6A209_SOLCO|nr:hypothetical protein H5410_018028 [Solanum commersonii]